MNQNENENIVIEEMFSKYTNLSLEQKSLLYEYVNQLNPLSKKTLFIAISHLGTSFDLFKSNGFKLWKNSHK
jgi:hypothetical protein